MDNGSVYNHTTEVADPAAGAQRGCGGPCGRCPLWSRLSRPRAVFKLLELGLSLGAFICEEVVSRCTSCGGLYFFEFVSCSAFLLSLLVVIIFCTRLYEKVDQNRMKQSDFWISLLTGLLFLLASVVFAATNDHTVPEIAAVIFGFLASFVFLADFLLFLSGKIRNRSRKPDNTSGQGQATEPLNANA